MRAFGGTWLAERRSGRALELRRTSSSSHRSGDRDVVELGPLAGAAQEQPAAAHVAAPDEIGGKEEPLAERVEEDVDVLPGGDAPEEDDVRGLRRRVGECDDIAPEGHEVALITAGDVDVREAYEVIAPDHRLGGNESAVGGDDEDRRCAARRPREGTRVREL